MKKGGAGSIPGVVVHSVLDLYALRWPLESLLGSGGLWEAAQKMCRTASIAPRPSSALDGLLLSKCGDLYHSKNLRGCVAGARRHSRSYIEVPASPIASAGPRKRPFMAPSLTIPFAKLKLSVCDPPGPDQYSK